ncbi:DNA-directed RNA polymerase I subunit RPA34 [Spathaspora sp. JA1]|nr:DNA-directed RNA polymerase I subunit RPA34 [Spathaspora sp. JA1]
MSKVYKSSEYISESDLSDDEEVKYQPPKHYHLQESKAKLDIKSIKDKEIWLIKTPKGFPLSELKTLPISFTATSVKQLHDPLKLKNGSSFSVDEELLVNPETGSVGKHSVFIKSSSKNNKLKPCGLDISRMYNIRELVKIPEINYDDVVIPRENVPKIENLRMRHFPTGYGAGDYKFEEEDAVATETKSVKRDREEDSKSEPEKEHKEKKHKKEKKEKKDKKKSKKDKS